MRSGTPGRSRCAATSTHSSCWTGTHRGPFRGFPVTGKAVSNPGAGFFRLEGGKIVAGVLDTDRLGFLEQIGVVSEGVGLGPRPSALSRP